MMRDPSYWRERDPEIVKRVTTGFELLYGQDGDVSDLPEARMGQLSNMPGINGNRNKIDTKIAHLAPGKITIPQSYQTPELMDYLQHLMGQELGTNTIGSGQEQINPESGLPAFADNEEDDWFYSQIAGAAKDMWSNYQDMRDANTIGAGKYFHCKGNFDASTRGNTGEGVARAISKGREVFGDVVKGDGVMDRRADEAANEFGRKRAKSGKYQTAKEACMPLRVPYLDQKY